ncbi:MAG: polyprenyl synthetase family protein [Clostridium sp.]|uniref:polyprenyl synthetase family protein n=1 Tax=Clostridium sp. TaxID=1506 RepID=UPI003F3C0784
MKSREDNAKNEYLRAKEYSSKYYNELIRILESKEYVKPLIDDLEKWGDRHLVKNRVFNKTLEKLARVDTKNSRRYLEFLDKRGKLDYYLERSVAYIYMRDLGKDIYKEEEKRSINKAIENIKKNIKSDKEEGIELGELYKKAKEEGVEDTVIWLIDKIKKVAKNIPKGMDKGESIRKIIKIILGVIMYREDEATENRKEDIEKSIRLGYAYGLTYPFIDDLFDSKILSLEEEKKYANIIRETLIKGEVAELGEWSGENEKLIRFIHSELKEGFEYIKSNQNEKSVEAFLNLSYIFFNSQEEDRKKDLNFKYDNEEIFIAIILKSASSRLIVPAVLNSKEGYSFESNMFYYGIYNQLADDFTDMDEDYKRNSLTPYTYYIKNKNDEDVINPFNLYFVVIYFLIHKVYKNDEKTKDIILSRAINSLKRFKARVKEDKYSETMKKIMIDDKELYMLIDKMVEKAIDVDFYDKLLRDNIKESLEKEKEKKNEFKRKIKEMKKEINSFIKIDGMESRVLDGANYSLEGEGKRLRPIIAWIIGTEGYGLSKESLKPLIKSLEYMHTASLILDDLPSQDNSNKRRGRETVHKKFDVATGELSSLFLIEQGIFEQASLKGFESENILEIIRYSAEAIKKMCIGQEMDLNSKGKKLNKEELEEICFYKTGIAFEASILMPAILGNASDNEKKYLKEFSKYAGIAFQIKDDLLDSTGGEDSLKEAKVDEKNNTSTFVTVLGYEEASKQLFEYYNLAIESLKNVNRNTEFLKELMNYILNREN